MDSPSRRKFFFLSTAAAAGMTSALRGADDKVAVAVIGLGGRGRDHMNSYLKLPDARIVALCDVDQAALERGQALVEKATGQKPKGYADMRQVFDDKSVQAVSMPLPITGTRCPPSGRSRPARTCTWRSLPATIPGKDRK